MRTRAQTENERLLGELPFAQEESIPVDQSSLTTRALAHLSSTSASTQNQRSTSVPRKEKKKKIRARLSLSQGEEGLFVNDSPPENDYVDEDSCYAETTVTDRYRDASTQTDWTSHDVQLLYKTS